MQFTIKSLLQRLAILLQVLKLFLPGILFVAVGYLFFTGFLQGKDIIITGLRSRQTSFFFIIGLIFWVLVTWYTSRLIAYNDDRLFSIAKDALYKMPRILGFACFTAIIISFALILFKQHASYVQIICIVISIIHFHLLHPLFEKIKNKNDRKALIQYRQFLWLFFFILIIGMIYANRITIFIVLLFFIQTGFLFIVVTRRKISETNTKTHQIASWLHITKQRMVYHELIKWIFTDKDSNENQAHREIMLQTEKNIFFWFSTFSIVALAIYVTAIFSLHFARYISPLPIILLSFGILLGAGNILSMFSIKLKINFHVLFLTALILAGFFNEPHDVQLITQNTNLYKQKYRPDLEQYFQQWINEKKAILNDSSQIEFPIYFVLADGGGSRSAYWTASVLTKLNIETSGKFQDHLFCLSGASGGSLGNMTFYSTLNQKADSAQLQNVQKYLSNDFLSFPLVRLMGPDLLLPFVPFHLVKDRADALESGFMYVDEGKSIGEFMQQPFSSLTESRDDIKRLPIICINSTRMQDGVPAVISNIKIKKQQFGTRLDVLDQINNDEDIKIATSISLGARFPFFSPAGRIKNQYFVDGGYFDNSGAGVVHEMILALQKNINDSLALQHNHPFGKIRFHVIHITNEVPGQEVIEKVHPLVNDLAAPIKTILGSYSSQTNINNLRLYKYLGEINKGEITYHVINLYKQGETESYPMNWSISYPSLKRMNERLYSHVELKKLSSHIR